MQKGFHLLVQLSCEEGQALQGQFMVILQLKIEPEAFLYRPGFGQVSCHSLSRMALPMKRVS